MSLTQRWDAAMMRNYATPTLALVRGEGAVVWDDAGKSYVDMLGGIAVNVLGHAHPAVVAAVTRQISQLGHVSNLFVAEPPVALAEQLLARAGRAVGCSSRTRGRRRTRPHSSCPASPAGPTSWQQWAASTGGRWGRCP